MAKHVQDNQSTSMLKVRTQISPFSYNNFFPAAAEDEEATTAALESGPSEADLVTDFLRILSREPTNAIFLGIALLLQMTARVKSW